MIDSYLQSKRYGDLNDSSSDIDTIRTDLKIGHVDEIVNVGIIFSYVATCDELLDSGRCFKGFNLFSRCTEHMG